MLANGVLAAYGVSSNYLTTAQTFIPCDGINRNAPATVPIDESVVTAMLLGHITYNVSSTQMQYIILSGSQYCPFLLVKSRISWSGFKKRDHTAAGSFASLCEPNTGRAIWFLEYFNCPLWVYFYWQLSASIWKHMVLAGGACARQHFVALPKDKNKDKLVYQVDISYLRP